MLTGLPTPEIKTNCNIEVSLNLTYLISFIHLFWTWGSKYYSKIVIIDSDNGLLPDWSKAIFWTNAWILVIEPMGINFIEILIETKRISSYSAEYAAIYFQLFFVKVP